MKTSKEEILKRSLKLFMERGYDGTTTAEIAKAIGLCNSGLFSHFKSKEELYRKVVEDFFLKKQDPDLKFLIVEGGSFTDFIDAYIENVKKTILELQTSVGQHSISANYLIFVLYATQRYEDIQEAYMQQDNDSFNLWVANLKKGINAGEIRSDINVDSAAKMFHFSFYGSSMLDAIQNGLEPEELKKTYYDYYDFIKTK